MRTLPLIFHIRRGAMDDGPGIRTTVFFKGCPLSCAWCHNPEAISPLPELMVDQDRCLDDDCRSCAQSCDNATGNCTACASCVAACPTLARQVIGQTMAIDELCRLILADRHFYRASGGGVTLSGGEPTMHHDYVTTLLRIMKEEGVGTALQTCGYFDTTRFCDEMLANLDLIYFDLKLADGNLHRIHTGRDNALILKNLAMLAAIAKERLVVRVPLVPGITATENNLSAIASIVRDLGIARWELLPYNPGGLHKRRKLGKRLPRGVAEIPMGRDEEQAFQELFSRSLRILESIDKIRRQSCRSTFITQ